MKKLYLLLVVILLLIPAGINAQSTVTASRTITITVPNQPPDVLSVTIPDPVVIGQLARFKVKIIDADNFSIWLIYSYQLNKDSILVSVIPGQPLEIVVGLTFTQLGAQSVTFSVKDNQMMGSSVTVWVNVTLPTGVEDEYQPTKFSLSQNYPNPFNPTTKIKFALPSSELVTLKIYDILGRELATLVDENKLAGYYEVQFGASNLPDGIYFYSIQAGTFTQTKKMILMK